MTKIEARNPRTGEIDYQFEATSSKQVSTIAKTMQAAQPNWNAIGLQARIKVLQQWKLQTQHHAEQITEALSIDTGRTMAAQLEVQSLAGQIDRWCASAPDLLQSQASKNSLMAPSVSIRHDLVPYPIVGVISPWNFPLVLSMIDTIPALLSGATVILKPSEVTPRFIQPLIESIKAIPELNGVLEIVIGGADTGIALIDNCDAICFTGSVETGRKVGMQAAKNFIPSFLELGGKDPAIVTQNADLDLASTAILRGSVSMTGQACQSLERIYVDTKVSDAFTHRLVEKAKTAKLSFPAQQGGQIGPLIFAPQADKIGDQIQDAITKGASVLCGGELENHGGGAWIKPTVITNVDHSMSLMQEETFGPLMPVMAYESIEQAIELANDSVYGLSGAVFSSDLDEANQIAGLMEVGAVSINDASLTAFVNDAEKNSFKLSGIGGSRMGPAGILRFVRKRAILQQSANPMPLSAFEEPSS